MQITYIEIQKRFNMKKIILLTFVFVAVLGAAHAQITDTVSIGTGYSNEVFYSLENGDVSSEIRDEWDIAFKVTSSGSTILTNGATGTELYMYPSGDTSAWSTMDTLGISSWEVLYNSDTTWEIGAFNHNKSGLDLGWGNYSTITHYVTADSLYFIKLSNGEYQKLWIQQLASGVYTFKYANLDGTGEVSATLNKSSYPNRNFAYYSLQTNSALDREPDNTSWDLLFTKYVRQTPSVYGVTGVLANIDVKIEEVRGVEVGTTSYTNSNFTTNMSEIGYDWKAYSGGYVIEDSLTYFIEDLSGNIFELIFTGFGGSSTGDFIFTKEKIVTAGIEDNNASIYNLGMFPNPANEIVNIIYSTKETNRVGITIFDLTGKTVYTQNSLGTSMGLNQYQIDVSGFTKGIYVVSLSNGHQRVQQKLIIK